MIPVRRPRCRPWRGSDSPHTRRTVARRIDERPMALEQDHAPEPIDARGAAPLEPVSVHPGRLLPSMRASSPECGVSTRGPASRRARVAHSASASTTTGTSSRRLGAARRPRSASAQTRSKRDRVRALVPARAPGRRRRRCNAAVVVLRQRALYGFEDECSNTGTTDAGPPWSRSRRPTRMRRQRVKHGAPLSPRDPPTTRTWPAVYLLSCGRRYGTRSRIARVTRACFVSTCSRPISRPRRTGVERARGHVQADLPPWNVTVASRR